MSDDTNNNGWIPQLPKEAKDWQTALEKESDEMYAPQEWKENKAFRNGAEWLFDFLNAAQPKQEAIEDKKMPDIEELIEKFLPNKFDLSTFKPKQILFLKSAFQQGAAVMFHELKNRSSDKAALLSQQQPEHTSSEIITAQVHEIDSLRGTIRELVEKIKILLTKVQEQEIEIASLKNKVKELQSDYMAVQTEIQSNESK